MLKRPIEENNHTGKFIIFVQTPVSAACLERDKEKINKTVQFKV